MAAHVRLLVRILAAVLVLNFSWLQWKDFPSLSLASGGAEEAFLRGALALYYASWVFGLSSDTRDEEVVLTEPPRKGSLPFSAYGMAILITSAFAVLCVVTTHEQFAIALSAFWLLNLVGWRYLVNKLLRHAFKVTRKELSEHGDMFGLEQLRSVENYIMGSWQWWRYTVGVVLLSTLVVLTFSDGATVLAAQTDVFSRGSLLTFSTLMFVALVELWIWAYRLKRKTELATLADLEKRNVLQFG